MTVASRRGSRQMRHSSLSDTLPQTTQKRTLSLTSVSAVTSRRTSTGSAASRWNAMRCALFGPTPGSRPSSSIRSWTGPSNTSGAGEAEPAEVAQATGERAHLLRLQLLCDARGVLDGADQQVLQGLDVLGIHDLRVDLDAADLPRRRLGDAHEPVARLAGHLGLGEFLLRRHELFLHLLRLLQDHRHVRLTTRLHQNTPRGLARVCGLATQGSRDTLSAVFAPRRALVLTPALLLLVACTAAGPAAPAPSVTAPTSGVAASTAPPAPRRTIV